MNRLGLFIRCLLERIHQEGEVAYACNTSNSVCSEASSKPALAAWQDPMQLGEILS